MSDITPLSSLLALHAAVLALFQSAPDPERLLSVYDQAVEEIRGLTLYTQMSEADLRAFDELCQKARICLGNYILDGTAKFPTYEYRSERRGSFSWT